jgi:PAS domain S-box-containing protein
MTPRSLAAADFRSGTRTAVLVGLAYFVVGSLWVLLSDHLVEVAFSDLATRQAMQTNKGLVYIVLTTAGLVFLIRLGYQRLLLEQQRAQDSDLRVEDLFTNHPKPMWVYDQSTFQFLRANDAAVAKYGYSRDEFLAMTVVDIRPPEDVAEFLATRHGGQPGHRAPGIFRHRTKSGDTLHVRITGHTLEVDGRAAVMVMAENVTEEVRMHRALVRQEEQFRQLHQSLGEVAWMATPDGKRLLYVSPAFQSVYGREMDELVAHPDLWLQAIHPDDRSCVTSISGASDAEKSSTQQYRIVRPDGSIRWVEDRKKVISDDEGKVVMMGGIVEDITARKERDEAQAQLTGKLEQLVADRTNELEEVNRELDAFARTAAHDLKNPLNGIIGLSRLLRLRHAPSLNDDVARYVAQIERSAQNMADLVNDLLSLSRAGGLELQCHRVDLVPIATSVILELRLAEPDRVVEVDLPERIDALCDQGLMRSVLQNLLGNAWKFTATKDVGRIVVSVAQQDAATCVSVADNGSGFDASAVDSEFRPFQRYHTQDQFQGTGLGLVTCQRIARRHGGRLFITSTPGVGTTVSFELPARAEAALELT